MIRCQFQLLLCLDIPLHQVPSVMASQKEVIKSTPDHGGHLWSSTWNSHLKYRLLSIKSSRVHNVDLAGISHLLVCGVTHQVTRVAKGSCPDGTLSVDHAQLLPCLNVPQPDRVVGGARDQVRGVPLGVQTPSRSTVPVKCSQPLTVQGVPHVGVVVLGGAEE